MPPSWDKTRKYGIDIGDRGGISCLDCFVGGFGAGDARFPVGGGSAVLSGTDGYLRAVRLVAARDDGGRIVAFLGTAGATGSIEMLFVAPEWRGRGIGARLVRYAVDELGCSRVEVNEQNTQAEGFYRRMGFIRRG